MGVAGLSSRGESLLDPGTIYIVTNSNDPILAARARVAAWVSRGLRLGAALFAGSFIAFFFGLAFNNSFAVNVVATWCLILGSAVLGPAIIVMYAVRAANRADAESSW